jgi:hypothetical protein
VHLSPHTPRNVFLEGSTTRLASLSRDHAGPRAVLNALKRLVDSYPEQSNRTAQELALAEQQLKDYQLRLGQTFTLDDYARQLATLRNQLKLALSERPASEAEEPLPSIDEITSRIKALRDHSSVDAPAKRHAESNAATSEEPIVRQLCRRLEQRGDAEPRDVDPAANHQMPATRGITETRFQNLVKERIAPYQRSAG